jgi:hypothetical protein
VVGDAVPIGDADREPAGSGAESGLALDRGCEGTGSDEFRQERSGTSETPAAPRRTGARP